MINEAEKRGLIAGVTIKLGANDKHALKSTGADYVYFSRLNKMTYYGWDIFKDGVWADIIKEPKEDAQATSRMVRTNREMILAPNTVIHCPTEELRDKVFKIFKNHNNARGRHSPPVDKVKIEGTCYRRDGSCYLSYCNKNWYRDEGYGIISAEQFLRDNGEVVWQEPNYLKNGYHAGIDPVLGIPQVEFYREYPVERKDSYTIKTNNSNSELVIPVKKKKKRKLDLSVKSDIKKIKL